MATRSPSSETSSHTLAEVPSNATNYTTRSVSLFKLVRSHSLITPRILNWDYEGSGTIDDPFAIGFLPNDPRDPTNLSAFKKWTITFSVAMALLAVAFDSAAYSGGVAQIIEEFQCSVEIATLGISLFVLGVRLHAFMPCTVQQLLTIALQFAIGPLFWAPFSELYGRQVLFFGTYGVMTAFVAGAAGSQNVQTLLILRFFAGAFGSSLLTNAGGVIADMFPPAQRGLAMSLFALAPFMGPTIGPIVGGFVGQSVGWRWVEGVMAMFTGLLWIIGTLTIPETYAPVILRERAAELSRTTGHVYRSQLDISRGPPPGLLSSLKTALSRPWIFLFREPIVLMLSIYMAIVYGTLYMMFAAFPIVFQENRQWSEGVGGLPFIGVAVGMTLAVIYTIPDNKRYMRAEAACKVKGARGAPPEARLPPGLIGCLLVPIGLFGFAWTNFPSIHWIVCIIFTAPFGAGMFLGFLSIMNYLIDAYTIYAASVLAANSVLRSLFGTGFPLFTTYMYRNLGIHWASSIPAFLALACVPFPFLFYRFGARIRMECKFSRESEEMMQHLQASREPQEREEAEKIRGEVQQGYTEDSSEAERRQAVEVMSSDNGESGSPSRSSQEVYWTPNESVSTIASSKRDKGSKSLGE